MFFVRASPTSLIDVLSNYLINMSDIDRCDVKLSTGIGAGKVKGYFMVYPILIILWYRFNFRVDLLASQKPWVDPSGYLG